jgi:hypothetical protein
MAAANTIARHSEQSSDQNSTMKRLTSSVLAILLTITLVNSATARRKYHPPGSPDSDMETVVNLVATWAVAYSMCKGKDAPDKCTESERISVSLKEMGWCYGETDQVAVGFRWHRC